MTLTQTLDSLTGSQLADLNQQAVSFCSAGRFAEAWALIAPVLESGESGEPVASGSLDEVRTHAYADALNIAGACSFAMREPQKAETYWRACLRIKPEWAEVVDCLGTLLKSFGRLSEAQTEYRRLVALQPGHANRHNQLGTVLHEQGDLVAAEASYRTALALRSDFAEAHYNLARALQQMERPQEAEAAYRAALLGLPAHAEAYNSLGNVLLQLGRPVEADAAYRQALIIRPQYPEALNNLGGVLKTLGRAAEAELAFRLALAIRPDYAEAHLNLGTVLDVLQRAADAELSYRAALALRPDYAEAHYNLGIALSRLERLDEAEAAYCAAIRARPDLMPAYNNLGCVLRLLDRTSDAIGVLSHAVALCPTLAEAHYNLGAALAQLGRLSESEAAYRRALALRPDYGGANFGLAVLLLGMGRFEEGWQRYECRYEQPGFVHRKTCEMLACAHWSGDALSGRSLLVWQEDGLGDMLQFSRYFALLKAQGAAHITFACMPALRRLMATVDGVDNVIDHDTAVANAASYDCWTSLLSAPLHLRTTVDTIPRPARLHADAELVEQWRPLLEPLAPGRKVGLVWQGNPKHHNDANRSIPSLGLLSPLWSVPDVSFVSLQKGPGEHEAQHSPATQPLLELGSAVTDFADTAAIVAQLDLVICVDTSIAHLAASLGKPCWVMLPEKDVDWRWMRERSDSPWYPHTLRVFRRADGEGWPASIERVRQACMERFGMPVAA